MSDERKTRTHLKRGLGMIAHGYLFSGLYLIARSRKLAAIAQADDRRSQKRPNPFLYTMQ